MKIKEIIKDKVVLPVLVWLIISILTLIAYFLSPALQQIYLYTAQKFYSLMGPEGELTLILLLLVLNIATWTYILLTRNKSRNYRFDKHLGIQFHKETNEPFCPTCMLSNIESPLQEDESCWRCLRKDCRGREVGSDLIIEFSEMVPK
jgi:hypothetical protein